METTTTPPTPEPPLSEKNPWEMKPNELSTLLKEDVSEERSQIAKKKVENPEAGPALDIFSGLVKPLTDVAADQLRHTPGLSWAETSPRNIGTLQTYLKNAIPKLQNTDPAMAQVFEVVEEELLPLTGGDTKQMHELALRLENLAWESYSAGKPTILFPMDTIWTGLLCGKEKPTWDARAILMQPLSLEKQLEIKAWTTSVINFYQDKFPELDLKSLHQVHLFVGENIAYAGTELASHTAGEALENGIMIDLNGCYSFEADLTESEIIDLYLRVMTAHELAHLVQKKAMNGNYPELEEWMCDTLACRVVANYIRRFDEAKQQPLMTVLETQFQLEFAANGAENRSNPTIISYRASDLWILDSLKNNPDLTSWTSRLDKTISTLWDPESEEAKQALALEETDAQKTKKVL